MRNIHSDIFIYFDGFKFELGLSLQLVVEQQFKLD